MANESMEKPATKAWLYGYPLVTAAMTKGTMTAVPARDDARRKAPVNQFCYMHSTPDASFTEFVSPNADTLYSSAWLDLSEQPLVLVLPDFGDRSGRVRSWTPGPTSAPSSGSARTAAPPARS
ncbi:DUF1254 domain-containing protein [Streptomyces flavochromogenes]|uniref:DUF1254 domain-containing protein n=1 Tax=Streptomyces flavochromogenes TaxID=68199 RepID=A0ABW6XYQ8_9ACTN